MDGPELINKQINGWVQEGWYVHGSTPIEGIIYPILTLMTRNSDGELRRTDHFMMNEIAVQIAVQLIQQANPPLVKPVETPPLSNFSTKAEDYIEL